ncbi:VOC family protein [Reichenbachiella carrageenanivorans]|uniref:VOC family protein n=1 Tax=Reichenbachiella carrageenanivorans TaxID=2979869 RepID=A0ABY6CXY4_9BACT|nr:VOC family protein [Reichenbachiella carrageenanivorans]UXX78772.1 VOC family protein [Reichenbachiella carrageenanivorans]
MKKKEIIRHGLAVFAIGFLIYFSPSQGIAQAENSSNNQKSTPMNSYVSIFEIPATDINRAVKFYQSVLDISIEQIAFSGMEMGIFPYKEQMVTGVIIKGEGYVPSATGTTIYLNGGEDLQIILDKIENKGGEIIIPKTPHADENGFFALFLDSEGNKIGLHSPN